MKKSKSDYKLIMANLHIKRYRQMLVKAMVRQKKRLLQMDKISKELEETVKSMPEFVDFLVNLQTMGNPEKNRELKNTLFNASSICKVDWPLVKKKLKHAKRQVNHYEPRTESKEA